MFENGSDYNLFAEIKKIRKAKPVSTNKIDNKTEKIEEHFAGIYSKLYNSVDDQENLKKIADEIESKINQNSAKEVDKVTKDLIGEAIKKVKPDKSDPVFDYSSDCLKNAPEILLEHIITIIRCFLIHSHISTVLILSTLVPIIKDKLGNLCI